jgi:hypothetical protein
MKINKKYLLDMFREGELPYLGIELYETYDLKREYLNSDYEMEIPEEWHYLSDGSMPCTRGQQELTPLGFENLKEEIKAACFQCFEDGKC